MANRDATAAAPDKEEIQIPEWETHQKHGASEGARSRRRPLGGAGFGGKLDSVLPPHRRYLGLSRKVFLLVLLAAVVILTALIVGLAAGLSSKHHQDLPLPGGTASFTGDLTYYGTGLGACGETSGENDDIVSISHLLFDAAGSSSSTGGNSNNNPLCFKMLRASRFDEEHNEERSVDLKVVDRCTGCAADDLDTSEGAFSKLAPIASGRVDVTWAWLQPVETGS